MRRPCEATAPVGRLVLLADMDRLSRDALLWLNEDGDSAGSDSLHRALRAAIATVLTERQRQVVEGYFFEGLSQAQLARRLGITQQVIQKCLHGTRRNGRQVGGALKKLRAALAPLHRKP